MGMTGEQFTITAGEHEATVVEVGAGLRRYTKRGVDVTCTYAEEVLPPKCCGAVLVPWPNRLRAGRYVCGDHRDTGSIQGALVSGRRAAEAVLADLP